MNHAGTAHAALRGAAAAGMDSRVLLEAAQWFSVLQADAVSAADRERWHQWLGAQGSAQRTAWARVEAISGRFRNVADGPARVVLHSQAGANRRQAIKALAGVGVGAVAVWAGLRSEHWQSWRADFSTATGETRELVLADGTRMWLNTASAADVRMDASERRVVLLRGEAHFTTGHAAPGAVQGLPPDTRPFIVQTPQGTLRALGTRFTVQRLGDESLAAVYEGAVEARPQAQGSAARVIASGEQARMARSEVFEPRPAELARQSWRQGLLVASDVRLDEFLIELGRYRPGLLRCDPAVAGLRIVGVYSLRDTDQTLAALERTLPVKVHRRASWWVAVGPA